MTTGARADSDNSQNGGDRTPANTFFPNFYRRSPERLLHVEGREHTGQVTQEDRQEREKRFRECELPVLFCSPTKELGIDIADLNAVHMRNMPPTPANYAQGSGRAGRSGQPALVVTYCSATSGHDQYFFQRPKDMVAGAVAAPQIDLTHEDLLKAHVHAIWLAETGLDLKRSMLDLIDASAPDLPLKPEVQEHIVLNDAQRAACIARAWRTFGRLLDPPPGEWFNDEWLERVINDDPRHFDEACNRWRQLSTNARAQLNEARSVIDAYTRALARARLPTMPNSARKRRNARSTCCAAMRAVPAAKATSTPTAPVRGSSPVTTFRVCRCAYFWRTNREKGCTWLNLASWPSASLARKTSSTTKGANTA